MLETQNETWFCAIERCVFFLARLHNCTQEIGGNNLSAYSSEVAVGQPEPHLYFFNAPWLAIEPDGAMYAQLDRSSRSLVVSLVLPKQAREHVTGSGTSHISAPTYSDAN